MSVTQWIIVGIVVVIAIDLIVCVRWIKRAQAARDAGEPSTAASRVAVTSRTSSDHSWSVRSRKTTRSSSG